MTLKGTFRIMLASSSLAVVLSGCGSSGGSGADYTSAPGAKDAKPMIAKKNLPGGASITKGGTTGTSK